VRECFHQAYERDYLSLTKATQDSYHHVYRELAFFVEDDLCTEFNVALDVAVRCRMERMQGVGIAEDAVSCRIFIASDAVKIQQKNEIWDQLAKELTCPRKDLLVLANTLTYCSAIYRAMWNEWVAFTSQVAARHNKE
jgi:hypothetical protein